MRSDRVSAWGTIVYQSGRLTLTKSGLRDLRIAGERLRLSAEDMEDIESAIGYRSEDMALLFKQWSGVRKFKAPR